jgi:hypothetical protein
VEDFVEKQDDAIFTSSKHWLFNGLQFQDLDPACSDFALKTGIDNSAPTG